MYLRRHHHQIGYPHLYRRIYLLQHNHHIDRYGRYRFRHLSLQITRPTDRTFPLRTDSSFKCNTIRILNPVRSHIHIRTYRRHCHDNIWNWRVLCTVVVNDKYSVTTTTTSFSNIHERRLTFPFGLLLLVHPTTPSSSSSPSSYDRNYPITDYFFCTQSSWLYR